MSDVGIATGWWKVVAEMAELVSYGYEEHELIEWEVKRDLQSLGFPNEDIMKAVEWIEKATLSGNLSESLAMLQPQGEGVRIPNPLEQACLSDELWKRIEICRQKGLISLDLVEKIVEGVRAVDTRDWDDEDVAVLMMEIMTSVLPYTTGKMVADILDGNSSVNYC